MGRTSFQLPEVELAFSPYFVDKLPFELLSNVFGYGDAMYGDEWRKHQYGGYSFFQSVICCVSKRWRAVAIATPALWTRLRVVGPCTLERALTWAKQSRERELDVALMLSYPGDMEKALECMDSISYRITTLMLSTLSSYGATKIIELPHLPVFLRRLRFSNVRFQNCNRLRSALAVCCSLEWLDLTTCVDDGKPLVLHQMQSASTNFLSLRTLVELILPPNGLADKIRRYLVAPSLQRVSFHGPGFPASTPNTMTFCFPLTGFPDTITAVRRFVNVIPLFPELEELTIHVHPYDGPEDSLFLSLAMLCLLDSRADYPLPMESMPAAEWTPFAQVRTPRLHTIRLDGVTQWDSAALMFLVSRYQWAFADRAPFTARPCLLDRVIVSGKTKTEELSALITKVKNFGLPVEEEFSASKGDGDLDRYVLSDHSTSLESPAEASGLSIEEKAAIAQRTGSKSGISVGESRQT